MPDTIALLDSELWNPKLEQRVGLETKAVGQEVRSVESCLLLS